MKKIIGLIAILLLIFPYISHAAEMYEGGDTEWNYSDYQVNRITDTYKSNRDLYESLSGVPAWLEDDGMGNELIYYLHGINGYNYDIHPTQVGDNWVMYTEETDDNFNFYRSPRYSNDRILSFQFSKDGVNEDSPAFTFQENVLYLSEYSQSSSGVWSTQVYVVEPDFNWFQLFVEPRVGKWAVLERDEDNYLLMNSTDDAACYIDLYDYNNPNEACLPHGDSKLVGLYAGNNSSDGAFLGMNDPYNQLHYMFLTEDDIGTDGKTEYWNYLSPHGVHKIPVVDGATSTEIYDANGIVVAEYSGQGFTQYNWYDPNNNMINYQVTTDEIELDVIDGKLVVRECATECDWTLYWDKDDYEVLDYDVLAVSDEIAVMHEYDWTTASSIIKVHVRDGQTYSVGYGHDAIIQSDNQVVWVGADNHIYQATIYLGMSEPVAGAVIKGSGPAVYYLVGDGNKYLYPNEAVFMSYFDSFSIVQQITDSALDDYPLGGNMRAIPGSLIMASGYHEVYYVTESFEVRHIDNEAIAEFFFGEDWVDLIVEVPVNTLTDYGAGEDLDELSDVLLFTE